MGAAIGTESFHKTNTTKKLEKYKMHAWITTSRKKKIKHSR
jgi:hypothetical protein